MSRRNAREMALQVLFQQDFNSVDANEALEAVALEHELVSARAKQYAKELIEGTCQHLTQIDDAIQKLSNDWKLDRMNGVDRNILRMAMYELQFGKEELAPNVVINEAVELAKAYSTDDSSRFVNGVLGNFIKSGKR